MRFRPKIGPSEFDIKTRYVVKFLSEGNRLRIEVVLRGSYRDKPAAGYGLLDRVIGRTPAGTTIEVFPYREGDTIVAVLAAAKSRPD